MSYILNAIRKSEQDRQAQEASNQESTLLEAHPKQKSKLSWLMIALISINILALLYFIFLNSQQQSAPALATANSQPPTTAASIQPKKPKIAIKTTIEQPKPELITPIKAQSTPQPIQKKSISNMLNQQRTLKKPAPNPVVKNVVNVAKKTNSAQPPAVLLATPVEIKPVTVKQPPVQVGSKPEKAKKIPFLREMASAFRRNVPHLNINVFVYAKNPDDRFVIIDMKKYRTGQETVEGLEIKAIKSNSLVLLYNNRTFQIERP